MWYGYLSEVVDHEDQDSMNNKIDNLRNTTQAVNMKNPGKHVNNTSGVMGVSFRKDSDKWQARIRYKNRTVTLGSFLTFEEAVIVRQQAEIDYDYHPNHGK